MDSQPRKPGPFEVSPGHFEALRGSCKGWRGDRTPRPHTGDMTEAIEPPPQPEVQEISTPEQFTALAHPLRQRLLFALGRSPGSISGLAAQLDTRKGNVAHHLKVLVAGGLVEPAGSRQVRGGTEQYYRRSARRLLVAEPRPEGTAAALAAVAQELSRSPEEQLTLRHLRLSPERARELGALLTRLVDEQEEAPEGEPLHGVLVALYRQADQTPAPPQT